MSESTPTPSPTTLRLGRVPGAKLPAAAPQIRPGCVVRLQHTALAMTVASIEDDGACCLWFDAEQKLHRQVIALDALVLVRE